MEPNSSSRGRAWIITPALTPERFATAQNSGANLMGAALSGNPAPIHTDAHYSSQTQWGRILVCGGVTLPYR